MTGSCSCTDAVLARFLDGDASPAPDHGIDLAEHLAGCAACRDRLNQARRLDALVASTATPEHASKSAKLSPPCTVTGPSTTGAAMRVPRSCSTRATSRYCLPIACCAR